MTLKKFVRPLAICVGIYYLSILIFLIVSRPPTAALLYEAVIFYPFGVLALPIGGILMMFWGVNLLSRGGFEGLIPAPIAGFFVVPAGFALAFAFPLVIFFDNDGLSIFIVVRGVLASSLVLPIAFATGVLHGRPGCGQEDEPMFKALQPLYEWFVQKFFE